MKEEAQGEDPNPPQSPFPSQSTPFHHHHSKPLQINTQFTVNYLINSRGFPLEKALSATKYANFETPHKPDSVLTFFENHGDKEFVRKH
ncbi:unnamed protein product [Camellia sinensis]